MQDNLLLAGLVPFNWIVDPPCCSCVARYSARQQDKIFQRNDCATHTFIQRNRHAVLILLFLLLYRTLTDTIKWISSRLFYSNIYLSSLYDIFHFYIFYLFFENFLQYVLVTFILQTTSLVSILLLHRHNFVSSLKKMKFKFS